MAGQADVLALSGGTTAAPEARIEHACLAIKLETANRVGFRAWSRLRGDRAERARPLVERIRRHSFEADAALERAGVSLLRPVVDHGGDGTESPAPETPEGEDGFRRDIRRRSPVAAAALLAAAVVAAIMVAGPEWFAALDDSPSTREGTLAGNELGPSPSVAAPQPGVAEPTPGAMPTEDILTVDFDRERMGQGLGMGWVQTAGGAGAVSLAPFPTAVNRSARLQNVGAAGAEACRPVAEATVHVTGLAVDVVLEDETMTALVIGRNAAGSPALLVSLGTSGSTFTGANGDVLARGSGLAAGEWVRTEITALGEQTRWMADGELSGGIADRTMDVSALATVEQVCLAVTTNWAGTAHFDNLTIATVKEG